MAVLVVGLVQRIDPEIILNTACRLGAFVASHHGAIPLLPDEMIPEIKQSLQLA